jgi:hypothetical protein
MTPPKKTGMILLNVPNRCSGGGHLILDKAIGDLPSKLRSAKAEGLPHTAWQLWEYLRLVQ